MPINRDQLYKFPWSRTDNPGGWIEVTDACDMSCPGCFREQLEGHRHLDDIKRDIIACQKLINCDGIAISGGEPLVYPDIIEVVSFISQHKMKPILLTNGEKLTKEFATELKKAGLFKIIFHIDSNQGRPGWEGKTEVEMNKLRQHYADLIWELGDIHCGFHLTIVRSSLEYIPDIVEWCRINIHKVQYLSFIAFRGLPLIEGIEYMVNGKKIDFSTHPNSYADYGEISITANEMFERMSDRFPDSRPCAYLNGTTADETYKFLIISHVGSTKKLYGVLGAKAAEMDQVFYHLLKGRYSTSLKNQKVGKKIFLLSLFDKEARKAFINFFKSSIRNPLRIFDKIYVQIINFQQPREIYNGETNLCDGCVNLMIYNGALIHSCRLDDYRVYGGLVEPVLTSKLRGNSQEDGLGQNAFGK